VKMPFLVVGFSSLFACCCRLVGVVVATASLRYGRGRMAQSQCAHEEIYGDRSEKS
jgi:hypothetical protein